MKNIIKTSLLAMVVSATPIAIAGPTNVAEPQGYEIAFTGAVLPTSADTIGYPYSAAERNISGKCALNVLTDSESKIVGMHVVSCSDQRFGQEAERWISTQELSGTQSGQLTAHKLVVNWSMDETQTNRMPIGLEIAAN